MKKFLIASCLLASGIASAGSIRPQADPINLEDTSGGTSAESPSLSLHPNDPQPPPPQLMTLSVDRPTIVPTVITPVNTPEPATCSILGLGCVILAYKLRSRTKV